MGAVTAQIAVGSTPQNLGGAIGARAFLYLMEGSRPSWTLVPENLTDEDYSPPHQRYIWNPTVENTLKDAFLMVGLYCLEIDDLIDLAEECFGKPLDERLALYDDITDKDRESLYEKLDEVELSCKMAITLYGGAQLEDHLKVIPEFDFDVEVCTTDFRREYSAWKEETNVFGELDFEPEI